METRTENDKIYAAAVVDGGSYFSIKSGGKYSSNIRIRRGSSLILDELQKKFGGFIGRGKTEYYLSFNGQQCTEFLMLILPYMKVKTEQAKILMEFNVRLQDRGKRIKPGTKLSDDEKQYREDLHAKLQELNDRR